MAKSKNFTTKPLPGFSGIWYGNQPIGQPYGFKYSGGLGTYPQQHSPIAIYLENVNRTYFVYGSSSTPPPANDTVCIISYFDHTSGKLAQPRELIRRDVLDAHENPVLCIDGGGHIIVFCPAHGDKRKSTILRSTKPHDIKQLEVVADFAPGDNFSYPQPWWLEKQGLVFLHTFYEQGKWRRLAVVNSADGKDWSKWGERKKTVAMAKGSYQISWPDGRGGIGTAFDVHPQIENDAPLNHRTNIYYMHTPDSGKTWNDISGRKLELPLTDIHNPALVFDAASKGKLVYLKDLQYDQKGSPIILYMTATRAMPGPEGGPHQWWLAKFSNNKWTHFYITDSTHCYDHGSLLLLDENDWRLIAPTAPGKDKYAAGGQMQMWQSSDKGESWQMIKTLTSDTQTNHTYARRPLNAHKDFVCFWSDGRGYEPSTSSLYFADINGNVARMPENFTGDFIEPEYL